jgi:spermidine synthase
MKSFYLLFVVFISGAATLALEILGTRILGPYYGVSLFLWSALIAVTLVALGLGYAVGGLVADRGGSSRRLCMLLLAAGVWVLFIPLIREPILTVGGNLGLRTAVLLAAGLLFFPPLFLLGMVSPVAIRLRAKSIEVVGRSAGTVSAISTLAGVVSALATGFYFVPYLGVTVLTLSIGALLFVVGLVGLFVQKTLRESLGATAISIAAGLVAVALNAFSAQHVETFLITEVQSPYAELRVEDHPEGRILLVDGAVHSQADTLSWQSPLEYVAVMDLAMYMFDRKGEALLVGLGGGSIVKNLVDRGWTVDAVEIDPEIVRLAHTYFGLRSDEAVVHTMDGRRFLRETTKQYDIIMIDAFGSGAIPFHMVSKEAFQLCRERLEPEGLLAINVWAMGWDDPVMRNIAATVGTEFVEVLALPIAEPPNRLGNLVLMASNRKLELKKDVERHYKDPNYRYGPKYQRVHAWDNRFIPDMNRTEVVTDDRNSIDVWSEELNYAARKAMYDQAGQ